MSNIEISSNTRQSASETATVFDYMIGDFDVCGLTAAKSCTAGQVASNGTQIDYDGAAVEIASPSWQLWSIDLSTAGNVSNVTSLIIGIEGAGASGVVYIDDIELHP